MDFSRRLMEETNHMHLEALADERYFLDKPVDEKTSQLTLTFLSHLNQKIEYEHQLYLATNVSRIQWLKTGSALQDLKTEFPEFRLVYIPGRNSNSCAGVPLVL